MAEITPTPQFGSWLEVTPQGEPVVEEYRFGSWLEVTPQGTPVQPEFRFGSWLEVDPIGRRRIRRGLGIVHTRTR